MAYSCLLQSRLINVIALSLCALVTMVTIKDLRGKLSNCGKADIPEEMTFYANQIKDLRDNLTGFGKADTSEEMKSIDRDPSDELDFADNLPMLYLITPTYNRLTQKSDLTRFLYTIRQVKRLHWIVIEDSANKTALVTRFLAASSVPYTHLTSPTPRNESGKHLKGVMQRNAGLQWIRNNTKPGDAGVFYFADDDNTYDIRLFELMRFTHTLSVWAVGFAGCATHEDIIVENNTVVGFNVCFRPDRKYAIDMAGFAVNIRLLWKFPSAMFRYSCGLENLEPCFIEQMHVELKDFEPVATNHTEVLVWHTKSRTPYNKPLNGSFLEV